jgi:hypothetical protein
MYWSGSFIIGCSSKFVGLGVLRVREAVALWFQENPSNKFKKLASMVDIPYEGKKFEEMDVHKG